MKTKTLSRRSLFIGVALACFGLAATANALNPAPDGAYPNNNTAEGASALFNLTTGYDNTALGNTALYSDTTGHYNTATGSGALFRNTSGAQNTGTGWQALDQNTIGNYNTATGLAALSTNASGDYNTADGFKSLHKNSAGNDNTATGAQALGSTTGSNNIGLGYNAGYSLTTGSNNIDIGNQGVAGESNTIRIGKVGLQTATFIAGINGRTTSGGIPVYVNSSGELGTLTSSARFKDDIKPMDEGSDALLALKPVTFHYKKEIDPNRTQQFGLVAEQVEKVNPDLVVRDEKGNPYTVRYDAVNAMLLNEFLKEHRKVEDLEKQVEKLTAGLQRVSDQLELKKPAPRTVDNP